MSKNCSYRSSKTFKTARMNLLTAPMDFQAGNFEFCLEKCRHLRSRESSKTGNCSYGSSLNLGIAFHVKLLAASWLHQQCLFLYILIYEFLSKKIRKTGSFWTKNGGPPKRDRSGCSKCVESRVLVDIMTWKKFKFLSTL